MKKLLSGLALLTVFASAAEAQLSTGGLPLTIQNDAKPGYVPVTQAALPDMEKGLKTWNNVPEPKPALVALMTPADVSFPNSGVVYNAENNMRIWRAQLKVNGAAALGLYYDRFNLPKGVKLFLSNADNRQILGGYDASNNDPSGKFANEAVEGGLVNIELDIESGVDIEAIQLHIDRAAVYFAGIEHLKPYYEIHAIDQFDTAFSGRSSTCMTDAICPLSNNYTAQRDATFQAVIPVTFQGQQGLGSCSATMMNTTANAPGSCKQYFMVATHCEFTNAITDTAYAQIISRFNFQHSTCNPAGNPTMNTTQTITGCKFVSRAVLPVDGTGYPVASQIKGDFLLLEFNAAIPASWGVTLAGWNNSANIPLSNANPKKFIGFHHPNGDVKKVSSGHNIQSYSLGAANTHWLIQVDSGLAAEGSSGSALFDGDGHSIGIASGAAPGQGVPAGCTTNALGEDVSQSTSGIIVYSKMSYDWDYNIDGNESIRKLKPWLDPVNSGAITIDAVKSTCAALDNNSGTGITNNHGLLDLAFKVFPNPNTSGRVTVQVNLFEPADLVLDVYDISGKKLNTYSLKKTRTGTFDLDLSRYSNGIYLLQLSDGIQTSGKKVMLNR